VEPGDHPDDTGPSVTPRTQNHRPQRSSTRCEAPATEPCKIRAKRSLPNLTKHNLAELTALVKTRLKRMQYRPALLIGFLARTGLEFEPFL
jgi:hypothetical protein